MPKNGIFHWREMAPGMDTWTMSWTTLENGIFWKPKNDAEMTPKRRWNNAWSAPEMALQTAPSMTSKTVPSRDPEKAPEWRLERTPATPKKCRRSEQLFY